MLSSASQYAIRAVLYLAEHSSPEKKYGSKELANLLEIPQHFIAKILQNLAKKDIITSEKGPGGGFYTNAENLKRTVLDIINVVEKEDIFSKCFLGLPVCNEETPCPVHHIVATFKESLLEKFKYQDIKAFSKEINENGTLITLKNLKDI